VTRVASSVPGPCIAALQKRCHEQMTPPTHTHHHHHHHTHTHTGIQ
jgi:hypothetical protein